MTPLAADALATVRAAGGDVRIVGPERLQGDRAGTVA